MLGHIGEGVQYVLGKARLVKYHLVGRCHHDVGLGVEGAYVVGGEGHARCRTLIGRFVQDLLYGQVGQLFAHEVRVVRVGRHDDVPLRDDACKALVGLLQERLAQAEKVNKLLGASHAALWPEAAPDATRHDDAIVILRVVHELDSSVSSTYRRRSITKCKYNLFL